MEAELQTSAGLMYGSCPLYPILSRSKHILRLNQLKRYERKSRILTERKVFPLLGFSAPYISSGRSSCTYFNINRKPILEKCL